MIAARKRLVSSVDRYVRLASTQVSANEQKIEPSKKFGNFRDFIKNAEKLVPPKDEFAAESIPYVRSEDLKGHGKKGK